MFEIIFYLVNTIFPLYISHLEPKILSQTGLNSIFAVFGFVKTLTNELMIDM